MCSDKFGKILETQKIFILIPVKPISNFVFKNDVLSQKSRLLHREDGGFVNFEETIGLPKMPQMSKNNHQILMPLLRKAAVKELDGDPCFIFLIFLNKESVRRSVCVLGRLQRWYVTIPSSDQWWATIKNHRNQWLPDPKTIEPNGCPKQFHSIVMVPLKTIENLQW